MFWGISEDIKKQQKWGIDFGLVIDKKFQSSYSTTTIDRDEENNTSKTKTTTYPDTYKLKLQKEVEGETMEKWIEVDKETYHKYPVGTWFDVRED